MPWATMATFSGTSGYRRGFMAASVLVLVVAALVCGGLVFTMHGGAGPIVPWIAIPACILFYVIMLGGMVPRAVTLRVEAGQVLPSWRAPSRPVLGHARFGSVVLAGVDTPSGVFVELPSSEGALVVGGTSHTGEGYALTAAPSRKVDCNLSASDFDAFVAALGLARGAPGPLVVDLMKNKQTAGGLFHTMAPWLLTMAGVSAFGVLVGVTGLGEALSREPWGQAVLGGVTCLFIAAGLTFTIVRSMRVQGPALELRVLPGALALVAKESHTVVASAAWGAVRVRRLLYTMTSRAGSYDFPVLELTLGQEKPLTIGAWDSTSAWPEKVEKQWRAPKLLVGSPMWPRLLQALHEHGLL